jgi:hypothetical protein
VRRNVRLKQVGLNDITTVTKICEEGCDVHFTTTVFPALTIAANRGSSDMVRSLPPSFPDSLANLWGRQCSQSPGRCISGTRALHLGLPSSQPPFPLPRARAFLSRIGV